MTSETRFSDAAKRLLARGFEVFPADHPGQRTCIGAHGTIPCDGQRGKHPAVAWSTWNTVTEKMIDTGWRRRGGLANPAVNCGPSGLVVLDDDGDLDKWAATYGIDLPDTYTVSTGRGRHLYYRWDHSAEEIGNVDFTDFKMDVRGAGGLVIGEGAQHVSGVIYKGNGRDVADLPPEVAQVLLDHQKRKKASPPPNGTTNGTDWETFTGTTGEDPNTTMIGWNKRHNALIAYAGRLRGKGLDYAEARQLFEQRWLLCVQPTGQIPEARYHETPPPDCNYPVTWEEAKAKLADVYERYEAGHPEADIADSSDSAAEPEATTWEPFDLEQWLDGTHVSPQPEVGIRRTDGQALLYPGREHVVFGETECGKSWFALECAAREIRMGRDVVYVHYEEGDPGSTIERLRLLSVQPRDIAQHLRFVAPARPVRGEWLNPLLDPPPALVIHDGVNEAMSLHANDANATDGAATFRRTIIKPFLAAGVTSLACDHVVKNTSDSRGRYAIGSVHKVNAIDGAAFLMENIEPFGRGLRGASSVCVTKDRPGQLRARGKPVNGIAGKTLMGVLAVDATGNTEDFLTFHAPKDRDGAEESAGGPTLADETYAVLVAQPDHTVKSGRDLRAAMRAAGLQFSTDGAITACDDLVFQGRAVKIPGSRGAVGYRAVVPDSTVPDKTPARTVPATVPSTVPPLGSGTVEQSLVSVPRNSPEQSGTVKERPESPVHCRYCGEPLPAHMPSQMARGYCHRSPCITAQRNSQEATA